jgi:hypothetical protein
MDLPKWTANIVYSIIANQKVAIFIAVGSITSRVDRVLNHSGGPDAARFARSGCGNNSARAFG